MTCPNIAEDWSTALQKADIDAVVEARIAIEVEAAALAAGRRSPAELRAMRRAGAERAARRTDSQAHVDADIAFHRTIIAAAHNPILLDLFDSFTPRIRQAMIDLLRISQQFATDADHRAHLAILDATAARDGQTAATLARKHLMTLKLE